MSAGAGIASLGQSLLLTTTIIAFVGMILPTYFRRKHPLFGLRFAQINLTFLGVCILGSLGLLMYGFLSSDFSIRTIVMNSSELDPIMYRLSAVWSHHEGSLLLWVFTLTLFGVVFALVKTPGATDFQKVTMLSWYHGLIFGFLIFLILLSNPFEVMDVIPHKGLGLNPLLHDPSMTFHPPTLYFGYIGFAVPFVMAIGLLRRGPHVDPPRHSLDSAALKSLQLWTYIPWVFLTFGITAGSLWAYYELGWGGFWAWDPVENASLLPWLSSTAALHAMVKALAKARKNPQNTQQNLLLSVLSLSLLTWLLSLFGTYLTRSGIVASVHGFAQDDERGFFLLVFIAVLSIGVLPYLFSALKTRFFSSDNQAHKSRNRFSKHTLITLHIGIMVVSICVLLIATLSPLFLDAVVSEDFYNLIFVPIALAMLGFMILVFFKTWGDTSKKTSIFRRYLPSINLGLLGVAIILYQESFEPSLNSVFAVFGIGLSLVLVGISIQHVWRLKKVTVTTVAHAGFAVLVLGVSMNWLYKEDQQFWLKEGDSAFLAHYEVLYEGTTRINSPHYDKEQAILRVINPLGDRVATLTPETRLYHSQNALISKTSIRHRYYAHIYAVLGPQMKTGERSIRLLFQPFVDLIWIGGLLMALAGGITVFSLVRRRSSKQAYRK